MTTWVSGGQRLLLLTLFALVAGPSARAGNPLAPHGVIAFSGSGRERHAVVLAVSGRRATPVGPRHDSTLAYATVSPNGRHVAYTDTDGLWISRIDGSHRQQLDRTWKTKQADHDNGAVEPTWSTDGRSIVFTLLMRNRNADELLETQIDTGATRTLFWKSGFDVETPVFSPDRHTIAFVSRACCSGGSRFRGIYLLDARGTRLRHLARLHSADGGSPSWSPDGSELAFIDLRPGAQPGQGGPPLHVNTWDPLAVFRIEIKTGQRHVLHAFSQTTTPFSVAWSPDGNRFVLHLYNIDNWPVNETDRLYVLTEGVSGVRLLSRTVGVVDPVQWR